MKNVFFIIFGIFGVISFAQSDNEIVYIPDPVFKDALISNPQINTNGDDEIQLSEAISFNGLIRYARNDDYIMEVTGLETFVNITRLTFQQQRFSSLDISHNIELKRIVLYSSLIDELNTINNILLEYLILRNPENLIQIDLSANYNLKRVELFGSYNLRQVNLSNWSNHQLETVKLNNNPNLTCVQIEPGFVVPYPSSTNNDGWIYDDYSIFSEDCWQENLSVEDEIDSKAEVQVYPNPAKEKVFVKSSESIKQVKLYDTQGRLLKNLQNKNEMLVHDLIKGNYFLQITLETGEVIHKSLLIE